MSLSTTAATEGGFAILEGVVIAVQTVGTKILDANHLDPICSSVAGYAMGRVVVSSTKWTSLLLRCL